MHTNTGATINSYDFDSLRYFLRFPRPRFSLITECLPRTVI